MPKLTEIDQNPRQHFLCVVWFGQWSELKLFGHFSRNEPKLETTVVCIILQESKISLEA